jgi:lipoprotein-releasing system permease protein
MLGVACLIIVLAVMTGFTDELKEKMLSMNAHINMFPRASDYFSEYEETIRQVTGVQTVVAANPYILQTTQIRSADGKPVPLKLKGIDPDRCARVTQLEKYVVEGDYGALNSGENVILLGGDIVQRLEAELGDELQIIVPFGKVVGARRVPKIETVKLAGVFKSGMYQYDTSFGYTNLKLVQRLFNLGDKVYGIEVRVEDPEKADLVAEKIERILGHEQFVQSWTRTNKPFFAAIKLEKYALFIVLLLIVTVAGFNIINSLLMKVMEKKREIGMLKAMGAQSRSIMRIFLYEGLLIGLIGTILGFLSGILLCYVGNRFQLLKVQADVYFLTHLPLRLLMIDTVMILCASIIITLMVTIIPAYQAARQNPVDAIRYE